MSMKLLFAVGWLVGTVSLFLQTGCHENDSPDRPGDTKAGLKETGWPVSSATPDNSPRDLLRRCHNAIRDGNSQEYLACYRGNDPAYVEAVRGSFKFAGAHLDLMRALEERYGQDAPERFKKHVFWRPDDLGGPSWPTSGTVKWDDGSDEALWYRYDVPEEDQLPRRLRRVEKHWCFVMLENDTPVDAIVRKLAELLGKTTRATEAARKGPAVYTLEQVGEVYNSDKL